MTTARKQPDDGFGPPLEQEQVACLHCGQQYSSDAIVYDNGFWSCPTPGCDGAGYTIDIYPITSDIGKDIIEGR